MDAEVTHAGRMGGCPIAFKIFTPPSGSKRYLKKVGKAITYGVTLLKKAPNRPAATAFLRYLLDPDGGVRVLKAMGQPPILPAWVTSASTREKVPAAIRNQVVVKE